MAEPRTDHARTHACTECGARLAGDQRYCVACGHRRDPLPARVAVLLGDISSRSAPPAPNLVPSPATEPTEAEEPAGIFPAARSSAAIVLVMLAFGTVIGAATGSGGVGSLARTLLVSLSPARQSASVSPPAGGGGSGGSSGGGGGGPAAPGAAQATTPPAQTVTLPSSPAPSGPAAPATPAAPSGLLNLPPVKHVFEIVLGEQGYNQSFGNAKADPYLAGTLRKQGELITNYFGVAGSPLANEVALISGQGPTQQTAQDCPQFSDIAPATVGKLDQVLGSGCIYPATTHTLGDQLSIGGQRWRAYIEGIGSTDQAGAPGTGTTSTGTTPSATTTTSTTTTSTTSSTTSSTSSAGGATPPPAATCPHPAPGTADPNQSVSATSQYVTWRNPFVYFHSELDTPQCGHDDVGLDQLAGDLKSEATTPRLAYISPGPCDDGSDQPCSQNAPAGLAQSDKFLQTVVPEIEASAAYKKDGLIAITFDGAPQSGPNLDSSGCCNQPTFPNLPAPAPCPTPTPTDTTTSGATTSTTSSTTSNCSSAELIPPGGGQVGLLLISRFIKPDSVDAVDSFNHFSLLKSVEDLFGLPPLGYAKDPALPVFDAAIYNGARP